MNNIQLLMTSRQAAAALAISERTLWTMTQEGRVPVVKLGRSVRYSAAALQAWIEQQQQAPPPAK